MDLKKIFKKIMNAFPADSRASSTLRDPDQWLKDTFGNPNDPGINITDSTVLTSMAFYRCVTLLAGSIATQPKQLFQRIGTDRRDKTPDRDHPAWRLIKRRPNPYQNSYQFHFNLVVRLLIYGNYYAYIERDRLYQPVALHPLAP